MLPGVVLGAVTRSDTSRGLASLLAESAAVEKDAAAISRLGVDPKAFDQRVYFVHPFALGDNREYGWTLTTTDQALSSASRRGNIRALLHPEKSGRLVSAFEVFNIICCAAILKQQKG